MKKAILLSAIITCTASLTKAQIQNPSFEVWNFDQWEAVNGTDVDNGENLKHITKTTDRQQGLYAARLENYTNDDGELVPTYLMFGGWDDQGPNAGYPYTQKPTTLTGYYKSNLPATTDSAMIAVIFFRADSVYAQNFFFIMGNQANYIQFSFNLQSMALSPDSVLLVMTSGSPFGSGNMSANAWIQFDDIKFAGAGITQQIPNTDFEQWTSYTVEHATGWNDRNADLLTDGHTPNVSHSTDAAHLSYSLRIETDYTVDPDDGSINYHHSVQNFEWTPTFKIGGAKYNGNTTETFHGMYKYSRISSDDVGFVDLQFTKQGFGIVNSMSGSHATLPPTATWQPFTINLDFGTVLPDTIFIEIGSTEWPQQTSDKGSVLLIDGIHLGSQPLSVPVRSTNILAAKSYPNPAATFSTIEFEITAPVKLQLVVTDINGRIAHIGTPVSYAPGTQRLLLNVSNLSSGTYFYQLTGDAGAFAKGTLVVE